MYFVALILGLHVLEVMGHGAMVSPLSRNAIGNNIYVIFSRGGLYFRASGALSFLMTEKCLVHSRGEGSKLVHVVVEWPLTLNLLLVEVSCFCIKDFKPTRTSYRFKGP